MARTARASRAATAPRAPRRNALAFDALLVEGALIAPAQLAHIAALDAGDQKPSDYAVPKGLDLRDELPRFYRIGQALFAELAASPHPSQAATIAFTRALLKDVFGFIDLAPCSGVTLAALDGRVPVVVVPPEEGLDRSSAAASAMAGHRTSAALAVQDWLNARDGALWGLACNGERLRLLRDNPSLTRPAYIEADLRRIFEADALADFAALWLLMHASRFGAAGTPPSDCILERWRDAGQKAGETARERLRDGVERALQEIGDGLLRHPANASLRDRLADGSLPLPTFFNQLLRLIYRMIFLLAAEDRGLLHPPAAAAAVRTLYATGYGLSRLRDRAIRPAAWDVHDDLWDGLCILFAALARGEPRLGLPALDGLFAYGETPDLDEASLSNRALLKAVRGLAWLDGYGAPVPVNWRDMETEELGSVYESLLELTPMLADDGRGFAFAEGLATRGNQRKTTGSYYTPDSLVQALLTSALDPVLDRVQAEAEDPVEALLGVKVLDPACGSGHFLLAAGRHIAARVARLRSGGTASIEEYRHALRDVARACLHGVDRNPMAVELTKVALWIETVEPGKPLGFLDANIRSGDALLGVFDLDALRLGIPDAAFKALAGDDRVICRELNARNAAERRGQGALDFRAGGGRLPPAAPLARAAQAWRALPEDNPEQIAAKRTRFEAARADPNAYALQVACDLYVAAFLSPKPAGTDATGRSLVPTTGAVWARTIGGQVYPPMEGSAVDLARRAKAFHWPLEFPEVMTGGGFDVVLGNPPWEVMQLSEEEYFAYRLPEISALPGAARKRAIAALSTENPSVFALYETDKRISEAGNEFFRNSGRFDLTARGKINTYALFAELAASLIGRQGRAGIIIPTGIATDATTAPFFASLVESKRLCQVFDFENSAPVFTAVHRSFKFCLMVVGENAETADFAFFLTDTSQIIESERRFRLAPAEIMRLNPNTLTAPLFRARADALITTKIYDRVPVLVCERAETANNSWELEFRQGLFNMTSDSELFKTAEDLGASGYVCELTDWVLQGASSSDSWSLRRTEGHAAPGQRYVPLYEAKMIWPFDHRAASYHRRGADRGHRVLPEVNLAEHSDPFFEAVPFYWVDKADVEDATPETWTKNYLVGWRDITTARAERTMVPCIIPRVACGDTFLLLFPNASTQQVCCLYANLCSIVLDFVARQKISYVHLKYNIAKQLPVLPRSCYTNEDVDYVSSRVLELTYTSHALTPFAREFGYLGSPFPWNESRRAVIRADLDAWYARAYGLTRDELRYVLDPADTYGADYPSETFRVLKEKEIREFGEYLTGRLTLEAWDRLSDVT